MSEVFEFEADLIGEEESEFRRALRQPPQARRFPRPRPRPPVRRPRYPRPVLRGGNVGIATAGSDFVRWVQQCLATVLGRGVPRNGVLGPATRRAVRMFQKRQGLRVTGIVDPATESALRNACAGRQRTFAAAAPAVEPALPPEPMEPSEPEPADGPTDADAEPADGARDEDAGEFGFHFEEEEEEEGAEQEFQVTGKVEVNITRSPRIDVTSLTGTENGVRQPGIYIIFLGERAWYVGLAERSIYSRFQDRFKALSDFDIGDACLTGRKIEWLNIDEPKITGGGVGRRGQKKKTQPYRPLHSRAAALPLLEQFLIKTLGTKEIKFKNKVVKRGGNKQTEPVHFVPGGPLISGGALIMTEAGKVPQKRDARNPI